MNIIHYLGASLILLVVTAAGVYSGRKVKSAEDFTNGGRKTGAGMLAGAVIGTLVGGSSTIGTAQLAFTFGFSAWWFTLGGGLGCLAMAFFFAKPLYESGIGTFPEIFSREYGRPVATAATLLSSIGSFLTITAQILSGIALITAISGVAAFQAALLTVGLMLVYVIFGGVWGAGLVGMLKTGLLYVGVGACGLSAFYLQGGLSGFTGALPAGQYFSLFSRGVSTDLGAGLSLVMGFLTTQVYIQAVVSTRRLKLSLYGLYACAVIIPLIGVAGIFVGMYMKLNYPDIASASALPLFVLDKMPPLAAGGIMAILLVALVGTGSGISLGLGAMLVNDIYKVYINRKTDGRKLLKINRLVIVGILAGASLLAIAGAGPAILNWSYLSMGLRGAVGFVPLCAAVFLPGRIPSNYVMASMLTAPVGVVIGKAVLPTSIDSLFLGVGCSLFIMGMGLIAGRRLYYSQNVWRINDGLKLKKQPDALVIAIDEQYGSGGEEIGKAVAVNLDIPCYGLKELTAEAAKISGIELRLLEKYAERKVQIAYDFNAEDYDKIMMPPAENFIAAMGKATRFFADAGPCVLVNSHASILYAECGDVLKIFVHANEKQRGKSIQRLTQQGAATDSLQLIDKQRRAYYRSIGKKWGEASSYHLAIDTTDTSVETTAMSVLGFLHEKYDGGRRYNKQAV